MREVPEQGENNINYYYTQGFLWPWIFLPNQVYDICTACIRYMPILYKRELMSREEEGTD